MSDPLENQPPDVPLEEVLGDMPLFRELQRVMLSSTGPVNWELARQVGAATASWEAEDPGPTDQDRQSLTDSVRVADLAVADLTSMPVPGDLTEVRALRRAEWVQVCTADLRGILEPLAGRLETAVDRARGEGLPSGLEGADDLLEALMQRMVPLLLGAQVGSVIGQLGRRALGRFDLPIPSSGHGLWFVVPNIARFEREWSVERREFRLWVALHEVAHRFEFSRPWACGHFEALVKDLVEHADLDLGNLQRRMQGIDVADPDAMAQAFGGIGNLFGETSDPEQRLRVARIQSFLAAAEGHADHVVDALARRMLGSFDRVQEALMRFRDGRPADRALEQLLGVEMTLQHYRLGRDFCARVTALTDQATLSRMWGSADSLPSMPELQEPSLWLARMA